MNYYEHHLGDYYRKAKHLTLLEHGAYRMLLDLYYIHARSKDEREATETIQSGLCAGQENPGEML